MTLLSSAPLAPSSEAPQLRAAVPWATVLPLAVVLAYADGFWMTSLRGAVGAISRTQEPFTSFWRTSTLMIPVFVLAVLAALTYALHRNGGELRSMKTIAATALLVAVAATVAAVALSAASAAYDYYLQSAHLGMMQSMGHDCNTACLSRQQWSTAAAHGRAILYISAALLATNVVLVGWVVAMRGGRLRVNGTGRRIGRRSGVAGANVSGAQDLRALLFTGLLAAAAIHAAVVPEHLHEWLWAGLFFVVLTVAELAAADRLVKTGQRAGLVAAVLVSAAPLAVWTVSRTVGLPFGPEAGTPEAVGLADCVASLLELGTLVAALVLLRSAGRPIRKPAAPHHRALALVAVVAIGALGLGGAASGWLDGVDDGTGGAGIVHDHH
jgi:hypothetical protein